MKTEIFLNGYLVHEPADLPVIPKWTEMLIDIRWYQGPDMPPERKSVIVFRSRVRLHDSTQELYVTEDLGAVR